MLSSSEDVTNRLKVLLLSFAIVMVSGLSWAVLHQATASYDNNGEVIFHHPHQTLDTDPSSAITQN